MAQGLGMEVKEEPRVIEADEKKISGSLVRKNVEGRAMGSRRIFAPHFKLKVLDSYRQDSDCRGNQRATARKYGIHRRQIQKWLQVETSLRTSVEVGPSPAVASELAALNLCAAAEAGRQLDARAGESQQAMCQLGGATSSGEESIETRLFSSPQLHDSASGDQDSNSEVTVSLFPSVKIEAIIKKEPKIKSPSPLSIQPLKEEPLFHPFSSVKYQESSHHHEDYPIKDEPESDDEESNMTALEQDQALDFTCAALSKRRSFSLQFKLEVLDAFHTDDQCIGNQRATARKFGINRRQVQKWLHQELDLRGETVSRGGLYRQRLGRWSEADDTGPCSGESQETNCALDLIKQKIDVTWDVPNRKRKSVPMNIIPFKKRTVELLLKQQNKEKVIDDVTSSAENVLPEVQETALCLVKAKRPPREYTIEETANDRNSNVSSSADLNRVIGQALYHSNREHIVPPYMNLPLPTHLAGCYPPDHIPFHHMLSFYRGFIADHNIRENIYPLDFKLKALDCYHGEGFCRGNQYAVASRFGIGQDQMQKWLKQEEQLRQHSDTSRMINIFR